MKKAIIILSLIVLMVTTVLAEDIEFGTVADLDEANPLDLEYSPVFQNFTHSEAVTLTGGRIYLTGSQSGNMWVELRQGTADSIMNGTSYLTRTSNFSVSITNGWVNYTFSSPYEISADIEYWIIFYGGTGSVGILPSLAGAYASLSTEGVAWYLDDCDTTWQALNGCVFYSLFSGETYPAYHVDEEDINVVMNLTYGIEEEEEVVGYTPSHSVLDLPALIIDFFVEFGITMVAVVGVIVLIGLLVWFKSRIF